MGLLGNTGGGGLKSVTRAGGYIDGGPRTPNPLDKVSDYASDRDPTTGGSRAGQKASRDTAANATALYDKTAKINEELAKADQEYAEKYGQRSGDYLSLSQKLVNNYKGKVDELAKQASGQATDARKTYTNSILPEYKNAMGMARGNAEQAMSLKQASDPNNPVMKQIREMYNQQGQAANKQGQQDFGVLSALGAQAAQGQFGAAGPMTSGQMGQIYSANQAQAGDAYARAQQRMHDLQQQGIDRGFDQSNQLYQFGQAAQDRYGQSIGNYESGQNNFLNQQKGFRDESSGYAGDKFNLDQGLTADRFNVLMGGDDIGRGNAYAGRGRDQAAWDQYYGVKQQGVNNQLQAQSAQGSSNSGILGSVIGGAASVLSDKREKRNIGNISDSDLDEFLKSVKPKTFEYKEDKPGAAPGQRIGFMMQDVEDTKLGKKMSRQGPNGEKMYDKDNLNGIILAGLARQAKAS